MLLQMQNQLYLFDTELAYKKNDDRFWHKTHF